MFITSRRTFLKGLAAAGAASSLSRIGFAGGRDGFNEEILLVVFLRGGNDGLNLIPPVGGPARPLYEAARPTLKVPVSGDDAALPLDGEFGLHPAAAPLHPFWQDGHMAIVHACGMHHPTRSHFEAEDFIELGTPGSKSIGTGWLHRHLASATNLPGEILIPALSAGYYTATSLYGETGALTLAGAEMFEYLWGPWHWQDSERASQRQLYSRDTTDVHVSGAQAMNAVDIVHAYASGDYTPAGGAQYPGGEFGDLMALAARMIKADVGIRIVTVDHGGWDTHENQGYGAGGEFATLARELADGIAAFLTDLSASGLGNRVTVLTMTEFGRRVHENQDQGTDHGHAAPMMLLGGRVIGGLHGTFPGLEPENMFEEIDVEVTTDYRRVCSEVLIRRLGNPNLGVVFPGYSGYEPLGVVEGEDLTPIYGGLVGAPLISDVIKEAMGGGQGTNTALDCSGDGQVTAADVPCTVESIFR